MKKMIRETAADFETVLAARIKTKSFSSRKILASTSKKNIFKKILKNIGRPFYKIIKPILRPFALRIRQFLFQGIHQQQHMLQEQANQLEALMQELRIQQSIQQNTLLTIKQLFINKRNEIV